IGFRLIIRCRVNDTAPFLQKKFVEDDLIGLIDLIGLVAIKCWGSLNRSGGYKNKKITRHLDE
ncbi:hypothetical protein, partial [Paramuribaculum intestinale]|uniref:hypothetical protein n=1 Tax=Paramuribaculum intestinale TaxID=2094151 RepID=UPI00272D880F